MGIPGSSFFNWESGAIKDAGEEALRRHGGSYSSALQDIQIGGLEKGYGANPDNVKEYLINKQRNTINNSPQMQALATASDAPIYGSGGFANQGESLQAVNARLKNLRDTKIKTERNEQLAIEKGIRGEGYAESAKTLAAQLQAQSQNNAANLAQQTAQHNATLTSQQNQFAHTSKEAALTRRHDNERADKRDSLSLQMQVMQNDLAEKRLDYDRETRGMDKRDRMIAQLMSGLGSLGSAFG